MDDDSLSVVHLLGANLAFVVAAIHVALGVVNWLKYVSVGILLPPDFRWPLFVVSGVALFVGTFLVPWTRHRRALYAGGILLMVVYVVGYFGWHVGGHRPLFFAGPGTHHSEPLLSFLLAHLFAGPVEFVAVVAGVSLAAVLAYLLVAESPG